MAGPQSDLHDDPKTPRWTEQQLADLYVWMRSRYPKKQDLDILDFHYTETREFIQRMRDNLVNRIMRSVSQSGHEQLRRLCETFPMMATCERNFNTSRMSVAAETGNQCPSPKFYL
jgi:hypothetical protein